MWLRFESSSSTGVLVRIGVVTDGVFLMFVGVLMPADLTALPIV